MRRVLQLVLLLIAVTTTLSAAEVVERIVATVNRHPLMATELEDEMRFEALQQARPLQSMTSDAARGALDRLIQQELVREQMLNVADPPAEDVAARVKEIRAMYPLAASEEGWRAVLKQYELSPDDLNRMVAAQVQMMRFIELRLRPSIRVSRHEVDEYYRDKFVAQILAAGHEPDPLPKVYSRIEDILVQQKLDDTLTNWMNTLRTQSDIHIHVNFGSAAASGNEAH
ncbi:MAG TPA: SurA N-terminal domain-containing protein [Candidatus Acidoferrales bacterium]|nr:SurA N-terminal domain-containing protein [Candidatus Acidoferrales bacterium]